jgi:RNA polymerase sigma-70 factor (ECF subfamily)
MEQAVFCSLLGQVRAGNAEAATKLVRHFEPAIRNFVRLKLTDPHMRQQLDSVDVCQSVLGEFFVRVAAGQFDLQEPGQLHKLLAIMARNKLFNHRRNQEAECRNHRRVQAGRASVFLRAVADPGASPSRIVAGQELLKAVRRQLSADERDLMDQRVSGRQWDEIAADKGEPGDTLRKRFARAMDRVASYLRL